MSSVFDIYSKITKLGQDQQTTQLRISDVAKKLIKNLSNELSNTSQKVNITSDNESSLRTENLKSLGALLSFLNKSSIKVNGEQVVFTQTQFDATAQDLRQGFGKFDANTVRGDDRKWYQEAYFAKLNLLYSYVNFLQNHAKEQNDKVLEVMVGKIIDQINSVSSNTGLTRKPKSTPDNPNSLPDDTMIDSIKQIFDPSESPSSMSDSSGPLYAKDLKSKEGLNAWAARGNTQIIEYDNNQKVPKSYDEGNKCIVLQVLMNRAKYLLSNSKSQEDTKKYNFYVNKVQALADTMTDPSGKSCKLYLTNQNQPTKNTTTTTTTTTTTQDKTNGQDGKDISSNDRALQNALNYVIGSTPLQIEGIYFNRISAFIKYVEQANIDDSSINNNITFVFQEINKARALTLNNETSFALGSNATDLSKILKDKKSSEFLRLIESLEKVVIGTGKILQTIYGRYKDQISENSTLSRLMGGQIGHSPNDVSSAYRRNLDDLQRLRANSNYIFDYKTK